MESFSQFESIVLLKPLLMLGGSLESFSQFENIVLLKPLLMFFCFFFVFFFLGGGGGGGGQHIGWLVVLGFTAL